VNQVIEHEKEVNEAIAAMVFVCHPHDVLRCLMGKFDVGQRATNTSAIGRGRIALKKLDQSKGASK
jgi:hypothetical protein